jgi:16S rRNA (cytosine1402-N4)-methyltransferase
MSDYHVPVLLKSSIDYLVTDPDGIYVDLTFGGGGHSREILSRLTSKGRLIVFDQDEDAKENLPDDARITFVQSNFKYLYRFWKWMDIPKASGILADLGVSSYQFDEEDRGFSYRFDNELDMRMNRQSELTAAAILNMYDAQSLQAVFSEYGELRNARTLAREILAYREKGAEIDSSRVLNRILDKVRIGDRFKYYAQVYQSLRIEVNDEMNALKQMLMDSEKVLALGGRLVLISYHSLEDRLVKKFLKSGNFKGHIEKDEYGKSLVPFKAVKKLVLPDESEVKINSRARSAKMRIAEKI